MGYTRLISSTMVKRLISDISESVRNVTSILFVESLLCDHKLTAVGTLRKNKNVIPTEFLGGKEQTSCGLHVWI